MAYSTLSVERRDAAAWITLERPSVHNAFNDVMVGELTDAFSEAGADESCRAVVLQGSGASFCAGADLSWMAKAAEYTREENAADARVLARMFYTIARCPATTIASVHGAAIGGGVGLVAACDIAIAAEGTTFALSEVRLGLVPAVIAPYVVQKIGIGAARAFFVSGERFDAREALRLGLVQRAVPAGDMHAAVLHQAGLARQAGPRAVAAAKRLLCDIAGLAPEEASSFTTDCIADLRAGAEAQEGMRAFLDKRKPSWSGPS